jgi:nitrite reductase/ring-hydroxylating ferredoxin subunit
MTEYIVGKIDDIATGTGIAVQAGQRTIAVFRVGDDFFAVNNACPHKGASLCEGEVVVEEKIVRCPLASLEPAAGWRQTGKRSPSGIADLRGRS